MERERAKMNRARSSAEKNRSTMDGGTYGTLRAIDTEYPHIDWITVVRPNFTE